MRKPTSERPLRVLSLGAGVQSTTVLLLSCHGQLPWLDVAIFADTGWEPPSVYRHLDWLTKESASNGIPVHVVRQGNIKQDALESQVRGKAEGGKRWASMPYFVQGADGNAGMIRRQCTYEYKIRPIERFMRRKLLGLRPGQRAPREPVIEQWFGISVDEVQRAKSSRDPWKTHLYPLIGQICGEGRDYLSRPWTRLDCLNWLEANYPGRRIPRSACIGCPFHSDAEWRWLRDHEPEAFADAVAFDRAIRRTGGMRGEVYLHSSRRPLDEVDLSTDIDRGQLTLWEIACDGMCGA